MYTLRHSRRHMLETLYKQKLLQCCKLLNDTALLSTNNVEHCGTMLTSQHPDWSVTKRRFASAARASWFEPVPHVPRANRFKPVVRLLT